MFKPSHCLMHWFWGRWLSSSISLLLQCPLLELHAWKISNPPLTSPSKWFLQNHWNFHMFFKTWYSSKSAYPIVVFPGLQIKKLYLWNCPLRQHQDLLICFLKGQTPHFHKITFIVRWSGSLRSQTVSDIPQNWCILEYSVWSSLSI